MSKQLILVANGSVARLFSRTGTNDPLLEADCIEFPEARLKGSEIERDRQGHERNDTSSSAARFEPHTSKDKKLIHQFARILASRLETGLQRNEYDSLWIIISSPFLGELKTVLSQAVIGRLHWTHEADLTSLDSKSLERRLHEMHKSG